MDTKALLSAEAALKVIGLVGARATTKKMRKPPATPARRGLAVASRPAIRKGATHMASRGKPSTRLSRKKWQKSAAMSPTHTPIAKAMLAAAGLGRSARRLQMT